MRYLKLKTGRNQYQYTFLALKPVRCLINVQVQYDVTVIQNRHYFATLPIFLKFSFFLVQKFWLKLAEFQSHLKILQGNWKKTTNFLLVYSLHKLQEFLLFTHLLKAPIKKNQIKLHLKERYKGWVVKELRQPFGRRLHEVSILKHEKENS